MLSYAEVGVSCLRLSCAGQCIISGVTTIISASISIIISVAWEVSLTRQKRNKLAMEARHDFCQKGSLISCGFYLLCLLAFFLALLQVPSGHGPGDRPFSVCGLVLELLPGQQRQRQVTRGVQAVLKRRWTLGDTVSSASGVGEVQIARS